MCDSEIETYRISLFGAPGVGKSSLTTRLALSTFSDAYDPTHEDTYRRHVTIDGKTYILEVIDTISQERSIAKRNSKINASDATLLVYSIASKESFQLLARFYNFIKEVKTEEGMWDPFQICIVGNKSDLKERRVVPTEIGRDYAKKLGCAFEECSAKTGDNVEKASYDLVRRIITYKDNERIRYVQMQEKAAKDKEKKARRSSLWRGVFK